MQFQEKLTCCGWSLNFVFETIELMPTKTAKLLEHLHALLKSGRAKRKLLEQVLGLLIWATSLCTNLRAWLAPDLHSVSWCQ